MDKPPDGGRQKTTIKILSNAGLAWEGATLTHNWKEYPMGRYGECTLHINGGAVRIQGIDVTSRVKKGVENIFRHNVSTGKLEKLDSDITPSSFISDNR